VLIINKTLVCFEVDANIIIIVVIFIVIILGVNGPLGYHNAIRVISYVTLNYYNELLL